MIQTQYMQDAELVAHKLSKFKTQYGGYPTAIKITGAGCYIEFKMWSIEDKPQEGEDDDREYNLECCTDDLLKWLEDHCREAGVHINMTYHYCEVRYLPNNSIYVDACIDLTNTQ